MHLPFPSILFGVLITHVVPVAPEAPFRTALALVDQHSKVAGLPRAGLIVVLLLELDLQLLWSEG